MPRELPTRRDNYDLDNFRVFLFAQGLRANTINVYVSNVRQTLKHAKSCKAADVVAHMQLAKSFSNRAWNFFAEFAQQRGFDVDPITTTHNGESVDVRQHPFGSEICLVVGTALRFGYNFARACLLQHNDVYIVHRDYIPSLADVVHLRKVNTGRFVPVKPDEGEALKKLARWSFNADLFVKEDDYKDGDDRRPLIPKESGSLLCMPSRWVLEIAVGLNRTPLIRRLQPLLIEGVFEEEETPDADTPEQRRKKERLAAEIKQFDEMVAERRRANPRRVLGEIEQEVIALQVKMEMAEEEAERKAKEENVKP